MASGLPHTIRKQSRVSICVIIKNWMHNHFEYNYNIIVSWQEVIRYSAINFSPHAL